MWFAILVVGLAVAWREAPELYNLADDTSNDGLVAVHVHTPSPISSLKLGKRAGRSCNPVVWIMDHQERLLSPSTSSALFDPVLALLQVQKE